MPFMIGPIEITMFHGPCGPAGELSWTNEPGTDIPETAHCTLCLASFSAADGASSWDDGRIMYQLKRKAPTDA